MIANKYAEGWQQSSTASAVAQTTNDEAWLSVVSQLHSVSLARLFYVTVFKRSVDIVVSLLLLILLSPILLVVMLVVALDSPGPAIFCQDRVGRHGRIFRLFKFRTMTHNPTGEIVFFDDGTDRKAHKVRNDPRITRVGKWLRRTSIDELPQLVNILRGDMSLIGPRPELPEIVATYQPWQHDRHLVRPGLTGWWQVSGRSDRPMHENTEMDIYYIRRQSLRLDMLIIFKTIRVVFNGLGAF